MAYSFDLKTNNPIAPVCYDLLYMMVMATKKFGNYMPKNAWEPFKQLFKAYIEAYPEDEQMGICDYLMYCLENGKRIKFTDIFRDFTLKKGFDGQTVEGSKVLSTYINELKLNLLRKEISADSPQSRMTKEVISDHYSPNGIQKIRQNSKFRRPSASSTPSSSASSTAVNSNAHPTNTADEIPVSSTQGPTSPRRSVEELKKLFEIPSEQSSDAPTTSLENKSTKRPLPPRPIATPSDAAAALPAQAKSGSVYPPITPNGAVTPLNRPLPPVASPSSAALKKQVAVLPAQPKSAGLYLQTLPSGAKKSAVQSPLPPAPSLAAPTRSPEESATSSQKGVSSSIQSLMKKFEAPSPNASSNQGGVEKKK